MVRLRAKREMTYMTRMLKRGDSFEATPIDARFLLGDESAEEAEEEPKSRRGRPPVEDSAPARSSAGRATESEPAAATEAVAAPEEPRELTRAELLEMARQRGIDLPPGYVSHSELLKLLQDDGA